MGRPRKGNRVCPRCGQIVSCFQKIKIRGAEYWYSVHYEGYEKDPNGKVKLKLKKCYLGPVEYLRPIHTPVRLPSKYVMRRDPIEVVREVLWQVIYEVLPRGNIDTQKFKKMLREAIMMVENWEKERG